MVIDRCLYCDKVINTYSLKSFFLKEDKLCINCRNKLIKKKVKIERNGLEITSFYKYDSFFKDLLLQYKECFDEALSEVISYDVIDYIKYKYKKYDLLLVPSSKKHVEERGFDHLSVLFKELKNKRINIEMIKDLTQKNINNRDRKLMETNYIYEGLNGKNLLIIDDVVTTGSTLKGVYDVMKNYYDNIEIITLAYTL